AVRAEALHDGARPGVPDCEAHPGPAHDVETPTGRAVEARVADDRLAMRLGGERRLRGDDDHTPGETLGDVVVGLAGEPQLHARAGEGAERLACGAADAERDRSDELAALDRAGQPGAEGSVGGRQGETVGAEAGLAAERGREAPLERARVAVREVA